MNGERLKLGRKRVGWTQAEAARRLGVSQPYLSLLERDARKVPPPLARRAASLYGLPPTVIPLPQWAYRPGPTDAQTLAEALAALGYPGFSYLHSRRKRNPAEVLLLALAQENLEARLVEALPWVVLEYSDLDWEWLFQRAKQHNLQNRLGYVLHLARRWAEASPEHQSKASLFAERESALEQARLAREDTLCHESLSEAEKAWLRQGRPVAAQHWNLLTDLTAEHLRHVL